MIHSTAKWSGSMARPETAWRADPVWAGEMVVCVASGASLMQADIDLCRGRRVIAVNDCWRLAPWADCLFAADASWWQAKGPRPDEFAGMRVTTDRTNPPGCKVMLWNRMTGLAADRRYLCTGANSGYSAVNLAVHLNNGTAPIVLLGYDMTGEHFFGRHPEPLRNPEESHFRQWRENFATLAEAAAKRDRPIEIINASRETALTCFPCMPLEEALQLQ
ncbi:MAG TPA: hypothetical protein VM639_24725 [Dongiaceae bacterium]|nr:hypothetical protein [Dongiaceae bacterium]